MLSKFTNVSLLIAATQAASGVYTYDENGADWGSVESLCDTGKEQSPIDLFLFPTVTDKNMKIEGFEYRNYAADAGLVINKKTGTMQMDVTDGRLNVTFPPEEGSTINSASNFYPAQLHFHSPSEHTVGGVSFDLEMHIVHTYVDGSLGGVLGIFFDVERGGEMLTQASRMPDPNYGFGTVDNKFIESLMFGEATEEGFTLGEVPLANFLAGIDMRKYWSYDGSLTTPPCTEGIKWNVIQQIQPITKRQLEEFTKHFSGNMEFAKGKGNNRVVQPLQDRTLYYVDNYTMFDWFKSDSGASALTAGAAAATLLAMF